jgi:hypothetical protein
MHNICVDLHDFKNENVHFSSPVSNLIIQKGLFVKLCYATKTMMLSDIYITFKYKDIQPTTFSKIEVGILHTYLKILNQPKSKIIDLRITQPRTTNPHSNGCLKLSGIWETDNECGIIYKFIHDVYPSVV